LKQGLAGGATVVGGAIDVAGTLGLGSGSPVVQPAVVVR
jgi:hypothetical protein